MTRPSEGADYEDGPLEMWALAWTPPLTGNCYGEWVYRSCEQAIRELLFLQWLIDANGYRAPKPLGDGRYACIAPMAYTHAIVTGRIGDHFGIDDRWCFHTYHAAKQALDAWDGQGEPQGWHRHPMSGRRVSASVDEIDEEGNKVGAVGVVYVRF